MAHVPGKLLVYWKEKTWAAALAAPSFHVPVSWYSLTELKHGSGIGLMYIYQWEFQDPKMEVR